MVQLLVFNSRCIICFGQIVAAKSLELPGEFWENFWHLKCFYPVDESCDS